MEKHCNRCNQTKPISAFSPRKGSGNRADGYQAYCKTCQRTYMQERYEANKDRYTQKTKSRKASIKAEYQKIKSELHCSRCPETHPATLDFHHADPAAKERSVSLMVHEGWNIDRIRAEIAKCEVLCSNCHRKVHWQERNGAA